MTARYNSGGQLGLFPLSSRRQFAAADKNSDGKLDFTEFVLWWRTVRRVGRSK